MAKRRYSLDFPQNEDQVSEVFRCSGWECVGGERSSNEIGVAINGLPAFSLCRSFRNDLKDAFPGNHRAIVSGFYGDVVMDTGEGSCLELDLIERKGVSWRPFHSVSLSHKPSNRQTPQRNRDYLLEEILTWPGGDDLQIRYSRHFGRKNRITSGNVETYCIDGVPHFHNIDCLPLIRLNEHSSTHPYGPRAKEIISNSSGLILDIGAGIQDVNGLRPNVVYLDAVHFENLDVVSTCPILPFKNDCFDSIVSQAVFEHLDDPFLMAKEAFRVLRPGGLLYLTTAFMQPLHGDPYHYFNMTSHGLEKVLAGFDIVEIGIEPFQYPSYAIEMGIESVLPYLEGEIEDVFRKALAFVVSRRTDLDDALGEVGREILAAGIFAVARKPFTNLGMC